MEEGIVTVDHPVRAEPLASKPNKLLVIVYEPIPSGSFAIIFVRVSGPKSVLI
jgi:hypothetical protein